MLNTRVSRSPLVTRSRTLTAYRHHLAPNKIISAHFRSTPTESPNVANTTTEEHHPLKSKSHSPKAHPLAPGPDEDHHFSITIMTSTFSPAPPTAFSTTSTSANFPEPEMTPSEEIVKAERAPGDADPLHHTITIHFPQGFGANSSAPTVTLGGKVWQGRLVGEKRKHELFGEEPVQEGEGQRT